jgi:molecular chaperone GrpE
MEDKEINNPAATEPIENGAENAPAVENEPLSELDQVKADLAEQKDKFLRLMAEFDNYKRRTAKERMDLIQTAGKDVIVSLLDVLDDCDRAEKQLNTSDDIAIQKEGIQLVFNKIRSTMQAKGLNAMESIGKDFDAEFHEAITEVPVPDDKLKGKVIDEVTKGYSLNEKIIRFAKVVVGK